MTSRGDGPPRGTWNLPLSRQHAVTLLAVAVAMLLGAFAIGYQLSESRGGARWHTGEAWVGEGQVSIQADGWTYGFERDVRWIDAAGVLHADGTPACLDRPPGTRAIRVRFAALDDTNLAALGSRPVVLVDCSGRA